MSDPNLSTELDADGILLATIDMPERRMNVFSKSLMDSLSALIERANTDPAVKGVVLTSGKPAFIAGADLSMIKMFAEEATRQSPQQLNVLFGELGRIFRRMELSPKPFVAAINGLALGGGLEVCMACHERVAADDKGLGLGLPEIKLGLLPGAGGTQRLPRLVGTEKGLEMLLVGDPVGAQAALSLGLVDEVVAPDQLVAAAKARAKQMGAPKARWDRPGFDKPSAPFDFKADDAFDQVAKAVGISDYQRQYYPAYHAIMDCVVGGWGLPMTQASDREMDIFVELLRNPVAGNMVRTGFLNKQRAAKAGVLGADSPYAQGADSLLAATAAAAEQARSDDEETRVLAVALAAARSHAAGQVADRELADVVVVEAGHAPSWTGGPFTWLAQQGGERVRALASAQADKARFAVPADLDAQIA